jgi:hypothetical protein
MVAVKIFRYIEDLDCFVVTDEYRKIADQLGLSEWNPVVWIGRLFTLDNDYGEHWFDNWTLRDQLQPEAEKRGITYEDLGLCQSRAGLSFRAKREILPVCGQRFLLAKNARRNDNDKALTKT